MEKTIAQQLNITEFPFEIKDNNDELIYFEDYYGYWWKHEYNKDGNLTYTEDSNGIWEKTEYDEEGNMSYHESSKGGVMLDNRPKPKTTCEDRVIEIDGKKYKLTEIKD